MSKRVIRLPSGAVFCILARVFLWYNARVESEKFKVQSWRLKRENPVAFVLRFFIKYLN